MTKALKSQGKNGVARLIENQPLQPGSDLDTPCQALRPGAPARLDPPGGIARDFPLPLFPTPFTISGQVEVRQ